MSDVICFGLCRRIPVSLCRKLTGRQEVVPTDTGYFPGCPDCDLVRHGAILSDYAGNSPALEAFEQEPALLEELYRNAYRCYLTACRECFTVYRVFLEGFPEEGEGASMALCKTCGKELPSVGECGFVSFDSDTAPLH